MDKDQAKKEKNLALKARMDGDTDYMDLMARLDVIIDSVEEVRCPLRNKCFNLQVYNNIK